MPRDSTPPAVEEKIAGLPLLQAEACVNAVQVRGVRVRGLYDHIVRPRGHALREEDRHLNIIQAARGGRAHWACDIYGPKAQW